MLAIKNIFKSTINYVTTNKLANINLRNSHINLLDAFYYRLAYSQINVTKESLVSHLNFINNTTHSRQGFDCKERNIPIDIESFGREGKNKEVKSATSYIKKNVSKFKNTIIIGDRAYFCYEFMKFLDKNGIYFIIRSKGNANKLDPNTYLSKNDPNYKIIMHLRSKTRHVECKNIVEKIAHDIKGKKNIIKHTIIKHTIRMEDNCHLITNLLD